MGLQQKGDRKMFGKKDRSAETTLQKEGFTYFAFISYKREDERWAKWLQRKLQSYHLPAAVCKEYKDLPKRLSPIFRDKTNLRPGILDEELRKEVQSAKYLIVICSKEAHDKSENLDKEIRYFVKGDGTPDEIIDGRKNSNRIIPFIVDKSEQPEKECFPLFLQELCKTETILGANIHEEGRFRALIKTIAYMLGVKLETILPFELQRRRRNLASIIAASLALLTGLGIGGYRYWDYYVPKTAYYLQYVERYGVPEGMQPQGIHPLTKEEAASLSGHYTIITCENKVQEVRWENAYDVLDSVSLSFGPGEKFVKATYKYSNEGFLIESTEYDVGGLPLLFKKYNYSKSALNITAIDLKSVNSAYDKGVYLLSRTTANGLNVFDTESNDYFSSISRYLIDCDANGFIKELRYVSNPSNNAFAKDAEGVSGFRYERDDLGRVTRLYYLSHTGKNKSAENKDDYELCVTKNGIAGIGITYNENDDICELRYYDLDGNLTFNNEGIACTRVEWEKHLGKRAYFYGINGEPVLNILGYHSIISEYDSKGNQIKDTHFGIDNQPVLLIYGYASCQSEYDTSGRIIKQIYLGLNNEPVLIDSGYASLEVERNERGDETKGKYFGLSGEPVLSREGYTCHTTEYDDYGNQVKVSYWGLDGEPVLDKSSLSASWQCTYDEKGRQTGVTYFDEHGEPTLDEHGCASWKAEYDEHGQTEVRFYGKNGELILCQDGYAIRRTEFDDQGNVIYRGYFDTDDQLMLCQKGYAFNIIEYDDWGNETKTSYYGINEAPIITAEGYAFRLCEYDDFGNQTKVLFLGTDEKPICLEKGYAGWTAEYDRRGNQTKVIYFDKVGVPTIMSDGYAIRKSEYDAYGNQIKKSYFDTEDNPVLCGGAASVSTEFDPLRRETRHSFFGVDGNLIINEEGYAINTIQYDAHGNQIKVSYLGAEEEPILANKGFASYTSEYDSYGNQLSVSYWDTDGISLIKCINGYAYYRFEYDRYMRQTKCSFYDEQGNLVLRKDAGNSGYAVWESKYDERGNMIERRYYGTDEHLIIMDNGYASWKKTFNTCGMETSTSYFDTEGNLVVAVNGYAMKTDEYDEEGRQIRQSLFGTDGQLRKENWAVCTSEYEKGILICKSYYDAQENPIQITVYESNGKQHVFYYENGALYSSQDYDSQGRVISKSWLSEDGKLILNTSGYAKWEKMYDDYGNLIKQSYYGTDGQLVPNSNGYATVEYTYDENGSEIKRTYFDERYYCLQITIYSDDRKQQVLYYENGILESSQTYDAQGRAIIRSWLNADGELTLNAAGYAKWERVYDENGNIIQQSYHGTDGQLVLGPNGYAYVRYTYDENGNKTSEAYYDTKGKLTLPK